MRVNESMSVLGSLCYVCRYDDRLSSRDKRGKKGENYAHFLPDSFLWLIRRRESMGYACEIVCVAK